MIEKSHRWHRTAIAAAAIALLGLSASEVSALSLGRISVQSALGELLKAEVEVPNISAEEAATLKANVASPAAFTAAGLEYNPAMTGLQVTLARRADGRAYIRLTSDRAINDPFIDIILEASWSSGRIVRDYTMLFDPPSLKQAAPAPTLAQTPAASAPAPTKAAPVAPVPSAESPRPTPASKPATVQMPPKAAPKEPATASASQTVVKPGDSASQIAARSKAGDVSLDQMLVAMLRANPDAFLKGNLNRLRAGAVLDLPSSEQAKSISAAQASQTVVAQSKDFNAFRRNLAGSAPKTAVEAANRKAAGKVEAQVEEKKPGSAAVDKLTLSKGALQAKADEARLLKERADREEAARAAELAKNIADLNKLSVAASTKQAPPAAATASSPAATALPEIAVAANPAPIASAPAPAASTPVAAPAKVAAAPAAPVPAPEPGIVDQLMEDPTLPLAGAGVLALLGGFFAYRRKQGKKSDAHVDSSFLEGPVQADSFFGASGGQHVDTAQDAEPANSSQGYTNSQLGSADDVDPVAEADVYLAYGRDMQAEEILKEALRHNPERLAIHSKLMDIYVKRHDTSSFQASANNAFQIVGAESPEWAHICELGLSIDPENPLYQPGGATSSAFDSLEQNAAAAPGDEGAPASDLVDVPLSNTDLDLDLDFSADESQAPTFDLAPSGALNEPAAGETVKMDAQDGGASNGIDFDIPELDAPDLPHADAAPPEMPQELADLSLSLDDLNLDMPEAPAPVPMPDFSAAMPELPEPEAKAEEAAPAKASDGMLEFDLGSLSLDLGPSSQNSADESSAFGDNSLETKLALAEEFVSIGDHDGARALIEEVVAEATGELREKAQRALASLS